MKYYWALLTSVIILIPCHLFAGPRKGFFIGSGIGPGFVSYQEEIGSGNDITLVRRNKAALDVEILKFGYGFSNHFLLHLSVLKLCSYNSVSSAGFRSVGIFDAIGLTYYLQSQAPSIFISGSFGIPIYDENIEYDVFTDNVIGASMGVGYEFKRHWNAELEYKTEPEKGLFWSLSLRVNFLLY